MHVLILCRPRVAFSSISRLLTEISIVHGHGCLLVVSRNALQDIVCLVILGVAGHN